jgi:hypothetical protein
MSNACVKVTVLIDRGHKNRLFVIPNTSADQGKRAGQAILHHLVLSHTSTFSLHSITSIRVGVFDVGQAKWSSTVLITCEFGYRPMSAYRGEIHGLKSLANSSFGIIGRTEFNDPGASRAAIGFVLDLSSLDFPNGCEKFN